jgi:hypothetical protein
VAIPALNGRHYIVLWKLGPAFASWGGVLIWSAVAESRFIGTATPLWINRYLNASRHPKRRRRCALPAHSKRCSCSFKQLFQNHVSAFSGMDVIVSSLALWLFVYSEERNSIGESFLLVVLNHIAI